MELENYSIQDKIWFHFRLSLRMDTASEQLLKVVSSLEEVLKRD
jgi:hypothetical protein